MKTFTQIVKEAKKSKVKYTVDQINLALLKAGIGPKVILQAMNALNLARGVMEKKKVT